MTLRILAPLALLAVTALFVSGTGRAQPNAKGKADATKPGPPAEPNAATDALRDELELLQAQSKLKELAVAAAKEKVKLEETQLKRLEGIGAGISAADVAKQKLAVSEAKMAAEARAAELTEHEVRVRIGRRKLDAAIANPPKAGGPSAAEDSLAKLVQLMAERNATEKEWIAKETLRLADEAKRQKDLIEDERQRRAKEEKAREDELKLAQTRAKEAEEKMRAEMKLRLDAEAERVRAEKVAVLKRLPGEIADAELRLRAAELKQQQAKLEMEAAAREIDRQKAARAHLEELKTALEKELKQKNDK